jgi:hypothetical protein
MGMSLGWTWEGSGQLKTQSRNNYENKWWVALRFMPEIIRGVPEQFPTCNIIEFSTNSMKFSKIT